MSDTERTNEYHRHRARNAWGAVRQSWNDDLTARFEREHWNPMIAEP